MWQILLRALLSRLAVAVLHFALKQIGDNVIAKQIIAVVVLVGRNVVALLDIRIWQIVVLDQFLKLHDVDSV